MLRRALTPGPEVWEFAEYHFATGRVTSNRFVSSTDTEWRLCLDSAQQRAKRRALATYRSERGNLGYVRIVEERLRPLARYDYTQPPHPGRTFYQRFQWVPRHPRIDYTTPEAVSAALLAFASAEGPHGCG